MLDEDQVREVETLAALLNQDQIADYFGICRNTLRAICNRDEEVAARYKRGKAKAIAHVANTLLQKARSGDTTSAIFYLKTQGGWRETDRPEPAVANRASLESLSEAELDACIADLVERIRVQEAPGLGGPGPIDATSAR
jgi:hypothetical protein